MTYNNPFLKIRVALRETPVPMVSKGLFDFSLSVSTYPYAWNCFFLKLLDKNEIQFKDERFMNCSSP